MIESNIGIILYVTGAATASMLLQFAAPRLFVQNFNKVELRDPDALFFARGAGLAIGMLGILLIWAAGNPALRVPVMTVAIIGKSAFIAMIISRYIDTGSSEFAKGFLPTVAFDSSCVLIYLVYLLGG